MRVTVSVTVQQSIRETDDILQLCFSGPRGGNRGILWIERRLLPGLLVDLTEAMAKFREAKE